MKHKKYSISIDFKFFLIFGILLVVILFTHCKKDKNNNTPADGYLAEVTTIPASNITQTTVVVGGIVTSNGGTAVTDRGVCWSTNANPTIADYKTTQGTGLGNFTSEVNNLNHTTTYYLRAYATNKAGTGYGNAITFTTKPPVFVTGNGLTDVDGNTYSSIVLGTQEWMAENLKTSKYRNGDTILTGLSNTEWGALYSGAYAIYNNDMGNNNIYGKLYNWYAVTDTRHICPVGWHVPTDDDWITLGNYLLYFSDDISVVGGMMKTIGTTFWAAPNEGATNEAGFSALPGGWMELYNNYNFTAQTYLAAWWSSSEYGTEMALYRWVTYNETDLIRDNVDKNYGMSIRCIKD